MRIVIVGGVAGGASTAARLRRLSEKDEIVLIERDQYISYANCGLPYYIGDVITDKKKLQVQTVEGMKRRFNVDVRVKNEVLSVDKDSKKVSVRDLVNASTYELSYDKLILSCGAKPIKPRIPGIEDAENVFTLRNIPDTYAIKEYVESNNIKKASVIGGGFIGVEMAENLAHLGIKVTLIEKMPQVLAPLDFEMAQIIHAELNNNGVNVILGDGVSSFSDKGKSVNLESGNSVETDLIILAIGVSPENELAKTAKLKLGKRGHVITTNSFHALSEEGKEEKDIYAIGDMIEVINALDDSSYAVPLAWGANRQGRLVADDINGISFEPVKIMGVSILKVFNLFAASTGSNERVLREKGIEYQVVNAHRGNHAGYYPGSSNIALKLIYDKKTGRIYGAQAVGREGTDKRIDVIATVMRLGGTVYDLSNLELCYAPPVSSAKDPVNILGYIAENIQAGDYKTVTCYEIEEMVKKGGYLLDVSTEFEYGLGHIEGAVNIDIDVLRNNLDKLPKDKDAPIYAYCQVGLRGYLALKVLKAHGYTNLYNLSGGYITYKNYKYKPGGKKIETIITGGDMQASNHNDKKEKEKQNIIDLDCSGLQCPGPIMATYKKLEEMNRGEILNVSATDGGFLMDIENWVKTNGHTLKNITTENGKYIATIEKGTGKGAEIAFNISQENATIVLFSGNLDKALASMIIAQGAAAQGKKVTVFFTFWGLNALRKPKKIKVKKNLIEKMFGAMMPRGANKLPLSNMNMAGMGSAMIKGIMKKKNVDALPVMIKTAMDAGVKMIACTMSMDLMGIKKEELLDGVEYAGVATYISANENVGTTLFI